MPSKVELLPVRDYWVVRVTENGCVYEDTFRLEENARARAEGQCLRLGIQLEQIRPCLHIEPPPNCRRYDI